MAWVLLTGAGLVAETAVIVFLGRQATTRSDAGVLVGPAFPPSAGPGREALGLVGPGSSQVHASENVHSSSNPLS